jgi:hypothetical protein
VAGFKGLEVKVGWFAKSAYPDGRPVAAVAAGNELGIASRSIPPRPFMRPTANDKQNEWREKAAVLAARVLEGKMEPFVAFDTLGQIAQNDIYNTITQITTPPLSKITLGARKYRQEGKKVTGATIGEIARKLKDGTLDVSGVSDKPLEDSFRMLNTLTHETSKT